MQQTRLRSLIYGSCATVIIFFFTYRFCYSGDQQTYRTFGFTKSSITAGNSAGTQTSKTKPRHCVDPYRQPGLFYYPTWGKNPNTTSRKDSRWIPYKDTFYDLPDPSQAVWPTGQDAYFDPRSTPPQEMLEKAPGNWMKRLVSYKSYSEGNFEKGVFDMSWIRDRRVLMVGDSLQRQEGDFFCQEMGEEWTCRGFKRSYGLCECHIRSLNFTLAHWHVPSMYTYRNATWWWLEEIKIVDFESRYEFEWSKTLPRVNGLNGRSPDLVLYESGHWDERAFRERAKSISKNHPLSGYKRHITWEEAAFFSSRMRKFLGFLQGLFGKDTPLMYHALTTKVKHESDWNVPLLDLDRINRVHASKLGLEVFEWAKIIHGHEWFFKDTVYPFKSPLSWLWGNMMLHYLFRALGGVEVDGMVKKWPTKGSNGFRAWAECSQWNS